MKIAEINMTHVGSTGKIMLQIAQCARARGHEVRTFSAPAFSFWHRNELPDHQAIDGHTYFGSYFSRGVHTALGILLGANGLCSIAATIKLIRELKKFSPDVLHLHNLHAFCINFPLLFRYIKKERIRVVWTLHDCWTFTGHCPHFERIGCAKWKTGCFDCPQYKDYPYSKVDNSRIMYKWKKKWFTGVEDLTIVTPSKWLANLVKQSYLAQYPVEVIHNGIDLQIFKPTPSDFRRKYQCEDKFIILGVADVWGEKKGLDVFVRLAEELSAKYQIVLVGTTDLIDQQLPPNIISIHRTYNQQALAEIYTAADLFVNPTREDTFPTINMEALACGTPVITFDTGGSPEAIDKTCGTVVPKDDIAMLRNVVEHSLKEKLFSREQCIIRAQQFSNVKSFQQYVALYENCRLPF